MSTPLGLANRAKVRRDEARATALLIEDELDAAARDLAHVLLERFVRLKRTVRGHGRNLEDVLRGDAS